MKITYFADTDTLAIDLADDVSAGTDEIADGVTVDYDAQGRVIGIDIEHAAARHGQAAPDRVSGGSSAGVRVTMVPGPLSAEYLHGYRIRVTFEDGTAGDIDLEPELSGEVFEPLRNPEAFRSFTLDEALNTITWPTGADLAPEFLYGGTKVAPGAWGDAGGTASDTTGRARRASQSRCFGATEGVESRHE